MGSLLACRSFRSSIGNSTTDNNPVTVGTEPVVELKSPSFIPISRATIKGSEVACGSHAAECAGADLFHCGRHPDRPVFAALIELLHVVHRRSDDFARAGIEFSRGT